MLVRCVEGADTAKMEVANSILSGVVWCALCGVLAWCVEGADTAKMEVVNSSLSSVVWCLGWCGMVSFVVSHLCLRKCFNFYRL